MYPPGPRLIPEFYSQWHSNLDEVPVKHVYQFHFITSKDEPITGPQSSPMFCAPRFIVSRNDCLWNAAAFDARRRRPISRIADGVGQKTITRTHEEPTVGRRDGVKGSYRTALSGFQCGLARNLRCCVYRKLKPGGW